VERVSLNDCQTFIARLNQLTGKTFRLPTEAEWEYAARGGNKTEGYKYAGSNNIDDVAWYSGNSDNTTHPVAMKQSNELGLYDMCGNVAEWCWDYYTANLPAGAQTNPHGPSTGDVHVKRGGSWLDDPQQCTVFYRSGSAPNGKSSSLGFRVCCSAVGDTM
jgi:formylglycine-generating enzyme required for sulfatase activity